MFTVRFMGLALCDDTAITKPEEMHDMTLLIGFAAVIFITIPVEAIARYVDRHH